MSSMKEFLLILLLYTGFAPSDTDVCWVHSVSTSDSGVLFRFDCRSLLTEILRMLVLCGGFAPFEKYVGYVVSITADYSMVFFRCVRS